LSHLSSEIVVFRIQKPNKGRVDGALIRQLDGALGQDLEDLDFIG